MNDIENYKLKEKNQNIDINKLLITNNQIQN